MFYTKTNFLLFLILLLSFPCNAFAAINVDGRLDESEWTEAQAFSDFVMIEPLTYDTARLQTEARLLSTPEGLAVAFICEQTEDTRTRTITQRDPDRFDSDAVNIMIDFDGKGEKVYQFSVSITGSYRDGSLNDRNDFNKDWDGLWQRAVNEEPERWTVEILLPWSIVAMREGAGETRQVGVFFQRDVYASGESFAFPATSSTMTRFKSDFAKVDLRRYSTQEFYIVPYATAMSDLVNDSVKGKAGLDLFWKPSGRVQVAATVNPDFGQVESDDLVIDFSAIEVLFSDKRPFFTENQSIFDDALVKNASIFYTRRIGGPRDDNGAPSDIEGAAKVIGSAGPLNYGLFAAHEDDSAGRSFYAGRGLYPAENWSLGAETTYTKRPFLGRTALVNTANYDVNLGESWRLMGQFVGSDIEADAGDSDGFGSFNAVMYRLNNRWDFEVSLIDYDDTLDISDMGYLPRNNLEEWCFRFQYNQTDFPETSRTASVSWMMLSMWPENKYGVKLMDNIMIMRDQKMRSGSTANLNINFARKGYDDLISRGNGLVYLKNRFSSRFNYSTPRRGAWRKSAGFNLFQEGYEDWGVGFDANVTWYPYEKLNLDFSLSPSWTPDWLIWLQGDQLAGYSRRQITGKITANWFPAERNEIRLNAQWLTIDADEGLGYRIGPRGRLFKDDFTVDDFAMINFGMQLRYRYEIAPLSDFYVVYSRGGLERLDDPDQDAMDLLGDSTSLRNSDQFLVKLQYRF